MYTICVYVNNDHHAFTPLIIYAQNNFKLFFKIKSNKKNEKKDKRKIKKENFL